MKVLEIDDDHVDVFEVSHKLSGECHGNSNDGYYIWEVVENPTSKNVGHGYLTDHEAKLLNDYVRKDGAAIGESVLIHHWW